MPEVSQQFESPAGAAMHSCWQVESSEQPMLHWVAPVVPVEPEVLPAAVAVARVAPVPLLEVLVLVWLVPVVVAAVVVEPIVPLVAPLDELLSLEPFPDPPDVAPMPFPPPATEVDDDDSPGAWAAVAPQPAANKAPRIRPTGRESFGDMSAVLFWLGAPSRWHPRPRGTKP